MSDLQQTYEEQRQAQVALKAAFLAQFLQVWPLLSWNDLDGTFQRWSEAVMRLIRPWRQASAGLALRQHADIRLLAVPNVLEKPMPAIPVIDWRPYDTAAELSLKITGPGELKHQASRGATAQEAQKRALVTSSGSASRHVLVGGRVTALTAVQADPEAVGWARISDKSPCAFCMILISRGPTYKSEGSASFRAHDHCACAACSVFSRSAAWPGRAREYRRLYDEVAKGQPDPINALRRHLAAQEREISRRAVDLSQAAS